MLMVRCPGRTVTALYKGRTLQSVRHLHLLDPDQTHCFYDNRPFSNLSDSKARRMLRYCPRKVVAACTQLVQIVLVQITQQLRILDSSHCKRQV